MKEKISKPIVKKYYDVKIETTLPATLSFRVFAEDPEHAILLTKNMAPNGVKHKLIGRRDKKITVYDMGSSMIRFVKNLVGL